MALKIGVISPEFPQSAKSPVYAPLHSSIFWFNEIEAGFAYLLHETLDKLYIDRVLLETHNFTQKYQKQIEQLHPHLKIGFTSFDTPKLYAINSFNHFPRLDTLFKNGDLKSMFQPIIKVVGNNYKVHGIECLSRFHFNGHTYAPEFIFNYAAEKLSLTNYDKICLMQALSLVPCDKNILIFINVRPQTIISHDFCAWLKLMLKKNNLLPEKIVIEVTEQYCNISEHAMSIQCKNLKDMGLMLAIDDFGTGISNLSMLEIMQPSYIKISGRFIKNSHSDIRKQKIIKNVLELAFDFNIIPIVESVESEQEWQQVKKLGASTAQGFYFFKPMDKESLSALFTD